MRVRAMIDGAMPGSGAKARAGSGIAPGPKRKFRRNQLLARSLTLGPTMGADGDLAS
jgi:hypothetical protein